MQARRRLLLASGLAGLTAALSGAWVRAQTSEQVIRISSRKFAFDPEHITLKLGVPVILEFVGTDVLMGFSSPDLALNSDMVPDKPARLHFVPRKTGTFPFFCDIFCGDDHEIMGGSITVVA